MIGWDINLPLLVRRGEKCKIDRKNKRLYGTNIEERYTPTLFSKGRSLDDVPEELIPKVETWINLFLRKIFAYALAVFFTVSYLILRVSLEDKPSFRNTIFLTVSSVRGKILKMVYQYANPYIVLRISDI